MLALPTVVWAGVLFAIVVYLGTMLLEAFGCTSLFCAFVWPFAQTCTSPLRTSSKNLPVVGGKPLHLPTYTDFHAQGPLAGFDTCRSNELSSKPHTCTSDPAMTCTHQAAGPVVRRNLPQSFFLNG